MRSAVALTMLFDCDIFHEIAKYLLRRDVIMLNKSKKLSLVKKYMSAMKIYKFWYVKKTQEWMNRVKRQCLRRHPVFAHRTKVNMQNYKYTREKFTLNDYVTCPNCNFYDIDCAIFFTIGHKLAFCDPYLEFYCFHCALLQADELFDFYHEPILCRYGTYYFEAII